MGGRDICICFVFWFLIVNIPVAVIITLNYVGVEPRFYLQDLHIPALNNSNNFNSSNPNTSIFIRIKFKRVVAFVPIRYQDVNITLFYASNSSFSVGYGVIPRFRQGRKKTVHRKAVVEARGLPWEDAIQKISGGSTVALAVELATKYSEKHCGEDCYYRKPKPVAVAAEVRADRSGHKVSNKPVRFH